MERERACPGPRCRNMPKDFKPLAKKMYTLYMMMMQQMSKQHHYDFGLRNIKSVLGCAGALKRKEPEMPEQILLMRAINDMNAPKWVSQDVPLYTALLGDIFPGCELPVPGLRMGVGRRRFSCGSSLKRHHPRMCRERPGRHPQSRTHIVTSPKLLAPRLVSAAR